MLHFLKVIQVIQKRNKGLIYYHENATHYNIECQFLSIIERKKEQYRYKQQNNTKHKTIQNKTKLTHPQPMHLLV